MAYIKNIFPVDKWVVRETHVCPCSFFGDGTNSFIAYAVEIGEVMHLVNPTKNAIEKMPIVRWMTERKLNYIKSLEGNIIGL